MRDGEIIRVGRNVETDDQVRGVQDEYRLVNGIWRLMKTIKGGTA